MSKKRYYKNGDPDVYKDINEETYKNWGVREKAMWSPYSDIEQAPIPADVVEFQKGQETQTEQSCGKCKKLEDEVAELKTQLDTLIESSAVLKKAPKEIKELISKEPLSEDAQKKILIEELRKLGIKANMNYKLETLQKKLDDANN